MKTISGELIKKMKNKALEIAPIVGVKFNAMPAYRSELIFLKNDRFTYKEIAIMLNEEQNEITIYKDTVAKWYSKGSQPKQIIIEILENYLFKRINK